MAVKKVTAYQTSTGNAYVDKSQAYHEEMVHLIQTRGTTNKKGFDITVFDEGLREHKEFLSELEAMLATLDNKRDKRIIENLNVKITEAREWIASAMDLKNNMQKID